LQSVNINRNAMELCGTPEFSEFIQNSVSIQIAFQNTRWKRIEITSCNRIEIIVSTCATVGQLTPTRDPDRAGDTVRATKSACSRGPAKRHESGKRWQLISNELLKMLLLHDREKR
jgi:hypothetical protein